MRRLGLLSLLITLCSTPALAQQVVVEEFVLDNGMKFLLLPRSDQPLNIAAGWLAQVGSVNERPGITGISHFFEHMMFKGTNTIGTNDPERDAEFTAQQEAIKNQIHHKIWTEQYERAKRGEIDDPWDPANDTPELRALQSELTTLIDDHKTVIVKNEFDSIYTKAGGSGMNAFTTNDVTFFFINVPSNKFELWAWMESDRLMNSVFREFYSERDVVHEERRLRTESTPTGVFQEQFDAMFWESSPYSWPVIGWTSDLNSYTMEEAKRYYALYYQPSNLVGVIVGDFNPAEIKPVIESYFNRIPAGSKPAPPVVTMEMKQLAEKRMNAECDCTPQVEVRYHTVPFNHKDSFALQMMASVLNGRTGRLYKTLIEENSVATSANASAFQFGGPAKYASFFTFSGESRGETTPQQVEQAWYAELDRLQQDLVPEHELQKVKNQAAADAYRALQSNFFILLQLGYYEALGGWEYINDGPRQLSQVTAEDIRRVANTYFAKENRSVATYTRKEGSSSEELDPELAALEPQARQQVEMMLKRLETQENPDDLRQALGMMQQQAEQVPDEFKPALAYIIKKVQQRIEELEKNN